MQQHVVEHAAERILGVRVLRRNLHGFRDRHTERTGRIRVFGQHRAPHGGFVAGAGGHRRAERLHQRAAVGLLVVAHPHHENFASEAKEIAGHRQRRSPLARAGFRDQQLHALGLVIEGLCNRRIGLVRTRRAHALVFVIDACGSIQNAFEPPRAEERRGAPLLVNFAHRIRDGDVALCGDFLRDDRVGEQRGEVGGRDRLMSAGVQNGCRCVMQIGCDIIPRLGDIRLLEQELDLIVHLGRHSMYSELPPASI